MYILNRKGLKTEPWSKPTDLTLGDVNKLSCLMEKLLSRDKCKMVFTIMEQNSILINTFLIIQKLTLS